MLIQFLFKALFLLTNTFLQYGNVYIQWKRSRETHINVIPLAKKL